MTDEPPRPWDGRGLPASATGRLRRHAVSRSTTSLLSVPDAAALRSVGFEPVGEVLGSAVMHLGWGGFGGCGYTSYPGGPAPYGSYGVTGPATVLSSSGARFAGFGPQVKALQYAYATVLRRMSDEAAALHADGVVAVHLRQHEQAQNNVEFLALGTAVRAVTTHRGRRPDRPFTALLSGVETAAALLGGLVPVTICIGVSVGVRHDDWRTQGQASSWRNTEIAGQTELVTAVRADARQQFENDVRATGADTAVLAELSLAMWPVGQGSGHLDHVARSVAVGTGLTRFRRRAGVARTPLTMLPLRATASKQGGRA